MNYSFTRKKTKRVARILLGIMLMNTVQPLGAYALTSGPGQPEAQSFQPAGVSDMVDLFSGDFKYNIPLIDVDGYPLNLNYQSGVGMDDEASWVGLGWNLNVGSINRQLRGIPDDFAGDADKVTTEHYVKPKVTVGGRLTAKVETFGKARLGGSFNFGVFSDNYTGIGAEIGVNAGMSFSLANDGLLTAGLGIGVLSNTASGVDVTPNVSLSISDNAKEKNVLNAGMSSSLGYNSRSGMKSLSFGASVRTYNISSPAISYNTEPIYPKVQVPYSSVYNSFSIDVGGVAWGIFGGVGGTGYRSTRSVTNPQMTNPAYGFLYANQGKNKPNAVMDFIREKENPVIPELPNLALPVHTPDIFTYNSQSGSGQFRLFRGGTGAFFDNEATDKSSVKSFGADIGGGAYFHGGVTLFNQTTSNQTRKWTRDNNYLRNGDFQDEPTTDPGKQHVFFKSVDEKNIEDGLMTNKLIGNSLLSISTAGRTANTSFVERKDFLSNVKSIEGPINKTNREVQNTMISYLTSKEASYAGLDTEIKTYNFNVSGTFQPPFNHQPIPANRESRLNNPVKKNHHISEITVNSADGRRSIYGMPVYNLLQEEYSFALGSTYQSKDGLVAINDSGIERNKGIDHYYHKDSQSPYAYSYLLTGLLSPDYVDKTGDGITDDDNGTAIKFNYSKIDNYKWRTPYKNKLGGATLRNTASLNRGLLGDPDDDKGSIVYGKKEICYVHSIESKTKIAYFITEDRLDGLGVQDINGTPDQNVRQKCLKEIRLYSKANLTKPIKVVKFEYTYELCPGTPNTIPGTAGQNPTGGKLTLKKVWFEYGLTHKGANHPYVFSYNSAVGGTTVSYGTMLTDRWGTYKSPSGNPGFLTNEEYPYTTQNKTEADAAAGLWHIQSIELPSGGKIDVNYEADDYAYVQNKKATVMVPFEILGQAGSLSGATGISVAVDTAPQAGENETEWFKRIYLNGSDYIYTKSQVKISTGNAPSEGRDYDFIPAYCKISSIKLNNGRAEITFEQINEANVTTNPIRFAAWQRLKNEYPRYAYPGFQNRVTDDSGSLESAVRAVMNAARNLSELKENFYQKANRKEYAKDILTSKSFARITKASGFKVGGGIRVRKIKITDNWDGFTGSTAPVGTYGQTYDYTRMEGNKKISSGVASYEPSIGNDENALKQPVPYVQKIKGAINNFFELEEPFGESFYPAPSVGYSKVTVRDLEANDSAPDFPKTGYIINEFYTAKDFPVRVKISPMQRYNPKPSSNYSLTKTQSIEEMVLSQGYSIELNDMHGKPKANRVFNQGGAEISSTEYFYKVDNETDPELKLNNSVKVINPNGSVSDNIIGRNIEFFTDLREQETNNTGQAVNIGLDVIPAFWFPIPIPHWPIGGNNEYKLFRSACAVKVIQTNGLINRVVKKENGSSISVENVAYDGVTGEAVVTKTQNEFKQNYYTTNLPAYWVYKGMGGAYQNLGTLLQNLNSDANGAIINSVYSNYVMAGDELVDISSGKHYWVIETAGTKRLIDKDGKTQAVNVALTKIIRSGYRNQLSSSTSNIVCLVNPIQGSEFKFATGGDLSSLKVISASTSLFDEKWVINKDFNPDRGETYPLVEDTSRDFTFKRAAALEKLDSALFFSYSTGKFYFINSAYWGGFDSNTQKNYPPRINELSIWPTNDGNPVIGANATFSFDTLITVPTSKRYYVANASPYKFDVRVDCNTFTGSYCTNCAIIKWQIDSIYLTAGTHLFSYTYRLTPTNTTDYGQDIAKYAAAEVYNNTYAELVAANSTGSNLNILFTTKNFPGKKDIYSRFNSQYHFSINGIGQHVCSPTQPAVNYVVNPYANGYLGNWYPSESKVYQVKRKYENILDGNHKGINTKRAGYYSSFNPWWRYQNGNWINNNETSWITSNTVTLYDKYGQELENKDALGRYSAASFDFNGQLPAAVASNAMNREIYINSFEDTKFRKDTTNITGELFSASSGQSIKSLVTSSKAHSSNYSLPLNSNGIILNTQIHSKYHKTENYLSTDVNGYKLLNTPGLYPNGFAPLPSKKYIISAWVKDSQANNRSVNVAIAIKGDNGQIIPISLTCKAIVEGWKLVEGTINTADVPGASLQLTIKGGTNIFIDDIRIHPWDAHLKSYAYDDKNFKLMAELDENAFSTFYEYDDEGSLIRVKKETERGIVTIKENRSSFRKR